LKLVVYLKNKTCLQQLSINVEHSCDFFRKGNFDSSRKKVAESERKGLLAPLVQGNGT
jgi:hypothetical protein